MAQGLLSKPPANSVRVSPGVSRDSRGNLSNSSRPNTQQRGNKPSRDRPAKQQQLPGLTKGQNALINQTQGYDQQLGQVAGGMLPQIQDAYSQPIDWKQFKPQDAPDWSKAPQAPNAPDMQGIPQGPVTGDFNAWRQQQIDQANQDFDNRFSGQFKQQNDDFEQQMANRGIPVGSDLYNKQKAELQRSQNDARSSNLYQAMQQAGTTASQFADVGFKSVDQALTKAGKGFDWQSQAHQVGMNDLTHQYNLGNDATDNQKAWYMAQRGMPLSEYNALMAAQSPMNMQNLTYSQQYGMQQDQQAQDRWMMQHTPRGGGGGGGGSGAGPLWQQYGFSSPMEYDAYKVKQSRDQSAWEWANNPQYRTQKAPNPYGVIGAQTGGIILGSAVGGLF